MSFLVKRLSVGNAYILMYLSQDSVRLLVVVEFFVVDIMTAMPARRVFRHTWRDSSSVCE